MSLIIDLINGVNKFLGYLDISSKYLNRAYTLLSIIPTLYILRIVYGLAQNHNYLQLILYGFLFIMLVYFTVLNVLYYFFNKNTKGDVTQVFVKYLPDDVFNIQEDKKHQGLSIDRLTTEVIDVAYIEEYQLQLATMVHELIAENKIVTNDLTTHDGFLLPKNTLFPYYFLKQVDETHYTLKIGTSYTNLTPIGEVVVPEGTDILQPVGVFLVGGDFKRDGLRYHEPYQLKLVVKKADVPTEVATTRRSKKQK